MIRTMKYPRIAGGKGAKHPLKLTALLYLKEVIKKELYEEAAGIVATAKEFGATDAEIKYLLEDPRRVPT